MKIWQSCNVVHVLRCVLRAMLDKGCIDLRYTLYKPCILLTDSSQFFVLKIEFSPIALIQFFLLCLIDTIFYPFDGIMLGDTRFMYLF